MSHHFCRSRVTVVRCCDRCAVVVRCDGLGTVHARWAAVRRGRPVRDGRLPRDRLSPDAASQLPQRPVSFHQHTVVHIAVYNRTVSVSVTTLGKLFTPTCPDADAEQSSLLYMVSLIDRSIELWFYVPLDTKYVISETFPQANLLAWCGKKLNLTQQKHAFANQKKCTTTRNKHKKLKPCLVAFCDIRSGNGAGLFSKEKTIKICKGGDK